MISSYSTFVNLLNVVICLLFHLFGVKSEGKFVIALIDFYGPKCAHNWCFENSCLFWRTWVIVANVGFLIPNPSSIATEWVDPSTVLMQTGSDSTYMTLHTSQSRRLKLLYFSASDGETEMGLCLKGHSMESKLALVCPSVSSSNRLSHI